MARTVRIAGLLILMLGSLAASTACGTNESATPPAATSAAADGSEPNKGAANGPEVDPCSLLTDAELKAIVGVELRWHAIQSIGPTRVCSFTMTEDGVKGVYVVAVGGGKSKARFDSDIQAAQKMLGGGKGEEPIPVAGLGDAAYFLPPLGELQVLAKGFQFSVSDMTKNYPGDMPPTLRPLAEKVIARL